MFVQIIPIERHILLYLYSIDRPFLGVQIKQASQQHAVLSDDGWIER